MSSDAPAGRCGRLGHTVLFPTLFGWTGLVKAQSKSESFWLAFVVMLHVGSALGLLVYFWREWVKIVKVFFKTLRTRSIVSSDHEDAARFAFLLATPIILAAGIFKLGDLTGPLGNGIRGQALVGCLSAAIAAYITVKFLLIYF